VKQHEQSRDQDSEEHVKRNRGQHWKEQTEIAINIKKNIKGIRCLEESENKLP
jgi:hypothetical protein